MFGSLHRYHKRLPSLIARAIAYKAYFWARRLARRLREYDWLSEMKIQHYYVAAISIMTIVVLNLWLRPGVKAVESVPAQVVESVPVHVVVEVVPAEERGVESVVQQDNTGEKKQLQVGDPTPNYQAEPTEPTPIAVLPDQPRGHEKAILDQLVNLTVAVQHLTASVHDSNTLNRGTQTEVYQTSSVAEPTPTPVPTPSPVLNVWEDGTCWTPQDMQVLHLCGAAASDGYVIRWLGVHGDSEGPHIPDSDWLAVREGRDKLVWAGHHPATGEQVTVTYWAGGHVLAVHVAGRLHFRIDRYHSVIQ